jgi:hypothetical protein
MVDSALVQATETISMHKQDLERLVTFLLEKETVDSEDVIAILGPPLRSASDTVITAEEAEAIVESAEAPVDDAAPAPIES